MQLFVLRHADAGDAGAWHGPDEQRPLTEKGRLDADALGQHLATLTSRPERIVSSPRLRALETARLVARYLDVAVQEDQQLGSSASIEIVGRLFADTGAAQLMIVGHDPDFSHLVADLTGAGEVAMKKGALARIDLDLPPRRGAGRLRWLLPPDALRRR